MSRTVAERLDALEKRTKGLDYVEAQLLHHARQYARLAKLGYALDDEGRLVVYPSKDAQDLAKYHAGRMTQLAIDLLKVETSG